MLKGELFYMHMLRSCIVNVLCVHAVMGYIEIAFYVCFLKEKKTDNQR